MIEAEDSGNLSGSRAPMYVPADFFMVRAPSLPATTFLQMTAKAPADVQEADGESCGLTDRLTKAQEHSYMLLNALSADPFIQQAIHIASPDLFAGIERLQRDSPSQRQHERIYASLMRYVTRMSTRPTPFGVFSGVAMGTFADKTSIQLMSPALQRIRTRPDMSWLLSFIEHIEQNKELIPCLYVVVNRMVYIAGERVIVPGADVYGKRDNRIITLRATPIVRAVLQHARQPVPFQELCLALRRDYPTAKPEQIDGLLHQLWNIHCLMSDLRPPLTSAHPVQHVVKRLETVPQASSMAASLSQIVTDTSAIDCAGIGGSPVLLQKLAMHQEDLVTMKDKRDMFQVDALLGLQGSQLNKAIGEAVAEAVEVLLRLSPAPYGPHSLREYYHAFIERYGMEAEVPLLSLLSPESGLDAPPTYTEPTRFYALTPLPPPDRSARDALLSSLLAETMYRQKTEIALTEDMVQKMAQWTPTREHFPPTLLEMYVQIQARSPEVLDNGDWLGVVGPNPMALGSRTFCRFFDLFSNDDLQLLKKYVEHEEKFFPDVIFAELSYLPSNGRGTNVAIRPMLRSYEIIVNTTPSVPLEKVITLDDLVVGVEGERFYIRSLRLGKKVIACQSHMLTVHTAPNVCRFLLDVACDGQPIPSGFDWGLAGSATFLPRVIYKQIVLAPAQWRLNAAVMYLDDLIHEETRWFTHVQSWREQWRVPRYVYLTQFDNRLLLDLEHPLCLRELASELKKAGHEGVVLQEMLPTFEDLWLRDAQHNMYIGEFVVPLLLNTQEQQRQPLVPSASVAVQAEQVAERISRPYLLSEHERSFSPGSEWTYLKLYATSKQFDEIITRSLREVVHMLRQQELIDRWFFIRYADPEPHIRVRFHARSEETSDVVLLKALTWSRQLVHAGLIRTVVHDTYVREVERYGGPQMIDTMEHVFSANSDYISEIVAALYTRKMTLDPMAVAVFTMNHFLEQWGMTFAQRLTFLGGNTGKGDEREAFRGQRQILCELLQPWDPDYAPEVRMQREMLLHLGSVQESAVRQASLDVQELSQKGALWMSTHSILSSLIHMHVNRLLGINREQENKGYLFWKYTLESVQRRPKQKEKKVVEGDTSK